MSDRGYTKGRDADGVLFRVGDVVVRPAGSEDVCLCLGGVAHAVSVDALLQAVGLALYDAAHPS